MARADVIERSITVSSPIGRVWDALTVAEQIAQWFGDSAEMDELRPGGALTVGWSEFNDSATCVIEEVDEPTTFSYRWNIGTADDGTVWTTRVTFTLSEADGMTTVTVVESGFAALPDELGTAFEENTAGWESEMEDLRSFVEETRSA